MTQSRRFPPTARLPELVSLTWSLLSIAALVVALRDLRIEMVPTLEAGRANFGRLWPFWIASASLWAGLSGMWWCLQRRPGGARTGRRPAALLVLAVAAAARAAVLIGHDPALSDDVYRYVFDGRNLAAGVNPYMVRPEQRIGVPPAEERWPGEAAVAGRANNPELHTIYLPTSQWAFAATGAALRGRARAPDDAARAFRLMLTVAELAGVVVLLSLLRRAGRSPWWAALYAWHPLAVTEIAGSGHQESLGLLLLLLSLLLWAAPPARMAAGTACLAAAALVKPIVLPIAPLLLRHRRARAWLACIAIGAVVSAAVAGPLVLAGGGAPLHHLQETSGRFVLKWAHFGSVYEPLLTVIEQLTPAWSNDPQEQLARLICTLLLAAMILSVLVRRPGVPAGARSMLLAMVLLSPAAHPWYLLWALMLMPLAPGAGVWAASLTLCWGYAAWGYVPDDDGGLTWGVPGWLLVVAYAPVYGALALDLVRGRATKRRSDGARKGTAVHHGQA